MVGGAAALWGLAIGLRPLSDNSALTHLATGRLIIEGWSIPRRDPFSFTASEHPWTVSSWLASAGGRTRRSDGWLLHRASSPS